MITIEKNIPIPTPRNKRNLMPLGRMEVGDSFALYVYETNAKCVKELASRVASALQHYSNRCCGTKKFSYRTMGKTSIRVWRVQ